VNTVAARLQAATANLTPPFAVVDLDALDSNAESMITRARGLPIRLATMSIRCRAIADRVLGRSGFEGTLAIRFPKQSDSLVQASRMCCWHIQQRIATRLLILRMMISYETRS
jgi:D-serine deaminase-like pyridoxal phosphate-dependent protein